MGYLMRGTYLCMNLGVKVEEGIYLKGAYAMVQTCSDARNMFFCRSCSDGTNDHGCAWSCLSSGPEDWHDGQSYCDICHLPEGRMEWGWEGRRERWGRE